MDKLRAEFEGLGFAGVESFIASGNVVFETRSAGSPALARRIERALRSAFGFDVPTFLRGLDDVARVAAIRPFTERQLEAATGVFVGFLESPLTRPRIGAIEKLSSADDILHAEGREIYWCRRLSFAESKLSYSDFERAAGALATFRGINTVRRLGAKYPPSKR
jgi:uncharacterized protein (DUF1697 family)